MCITMCVHYKIGTLQCIALLHRCIIVYVHYRICTLQCVHYNINTLRIPVGAWLGHTNTMHEWFPVVTVIMHQLAWLTGA